MMEHDKERIEEEYKAIQTFSDNLEKSCVASIANEKLNRYSNISPFDYNRVVLSDDEFENDYINASYINVRYFLLYPCYRILITYVLKRVIIILKNTLPHKDQSQTQRE